MNTIVLLSGGIDSTVACAVTQPDLALSFYYGQTHARELDHARSIAAYYGIEHHQLNIKDVLDTPSALTGHGTIPAGHTAATVVPGRNLVMLAIATAWATAWGYGAVVIGANKDDRADYPDCRPDFVEAAGHATSIGYGVTVWAPLLTMTKREIVARGRELGAPLDKTWSCYRGGSMPCGKCGACTSRAEALA